MYPLNGATRVLCILGNPVSHSLSPAIQNAAISACDLDYIYVPFSVRPQSLGEAVSGLRALGVSGFNVTIPYKTAIMSYLDKLDESAAAAGAVNTVSISGDHMTGYNTDGHGLISSLADDLSFVAGSDSIVVIGAGGAARGAVAALCRAGAERIVLANRSYNKAVQLAAEMSNRYEKTCIKVSAQDQLSENHLNSASLLINTTSLGMKGDRISFVDLARLPKSAKVYDMVYSPAETPLLREATAKGIAAVNGLGMLAAQGERAFTIWTGKIPPKGLMKRVLQDICHS
ncbi:MAG: shikimate dehydrogenase [Desulfuromonadales bacterium]